MSKQFLTRRAEKRGESSSRPVVDRGEALHRFFAPEITMRPATENLSSRSAHRTTDGCPPSVQYNHQKLGINGICLKNEAVREFDRSPQPFCTCTMNMFSIHGRLGRSRVHRRGCRGFSGVNEVRLSYAMERVYEQHRDVERRESGKVRQVRCGEQVRRVRRMGRVGSAGLGKLVGASGGEPPTLRQVLGAGTSGQPPDPRIAV
jgi:hypothetical protein